MNSAIVQLLAVLHRRRRLETQKMPGANVDFTHQMIATFCQLIDSADRDSVSAPVDGGHRPCWVRRPRSSATSDRSRGINATKYGVNAWPCWLAAASRVVGL